MDTKLRIIMKKAFLFVTLSFVFNLYINESIGCVYQREYSNDTVYANNRFNRDHSIALFQDSNEFGYTHISDSVFFMCPECISVTFGKMKYFNDSTNICKLCNFDKLRTIKLLGNTIKEFPKCISKLKHLECLRFIECSIDIFPNEVFYSESIDTVSFHQCTIGEFINNNSKPIKIGSFSLHAKQMKELPSVLLNFNNLKSLTICGNDSTNVSILSNVIKNNYLIKNLTIGELNLDSIIEYIFSLHNLKLLSLDRCNISNISCRITELSKVSYLYLRDNHITELPECIKELSNTIKYLELSGNNISKEEQEKIKKWLPKTKIIFD